MCCSYTPTYDVCNLLYIWAYLAVPPFHNHKLQQLHSWLWSLDMYLRNLQISMHIHVDKFISVDYLHCSQQSFSYVRMLPVFNCFAVTVFILMINLNKNKLLNLKVNFL